MKIKILFIFLSLFLITSCTHNNAQIMENENKDVTTDNKSEDAIIDNKNESTEEIKYDYDLSQVFENVESITISFEYILNLQTTILEFNNKDALNNFINKVKDVTNSNVFITGEKTDYGIGGELTKKDEEYIGLSNIKLYIKYKDNKDDCTVSEFINGDRQIYPTENSVINLKIKNKNYYYEDENDLIIKTVVDMVKNHLLYLNLYLPEDTNKYFVTDFLKPYKVVTDEFTITSKTPLEVLETHWIDYVKSNKNLKLYDKDTEISDFPNDGKQHFIKVIDEKGNIYAVHYQDVEDMSNIMVPKNK